MAVNSTFRIGASSSGTSTTPTFTRPQGTAPPVASPRPGLDEVRTRLVSWMASPEAARYYGRWVLFNEAFEVQDHDESAVALTSRHPDVDDPVIVFAQPVRTRIG